MEVICCNDYSISGNVGNTAGISVTLAGDVSDAAVTDENGDYIFEHLANGDYTVTPWRESTWMTPTDASITINNLDVTGVDFSLRVNQAPEEPSSSTPENNAERINVQMNLSWISGDPDPGDTINL